MQRRCAQERPGAATAAGGNGAAVVGSMAGALPLLDPAATHSRKTGRRWRRQPWSRPMTPRGGRRWRVSNGRHGWRRRECGRGRAGARAGARRRGACGGEAATAVAGARRRARDSHPWSMPSTMVACLPPDTSLISNSLYRKCLSSSLSCSERYQHSLVSDMPLGLSFSYCS
uniref:Uncharacterized protein n=1 Tax=Oryza meridionalis TaxID=40149 RepID=A0A0E0ERM6_9ORYZ